jgi:hypothetical protein
MKILNHNEREALKQSRRQEDIDYSHWHRFLNCMFPEGQEVDESKVRPTIEEYKDWKKQYPGWSDGLLTRTHSAWRSEYIGKTLPMNTVLQEFDKNKKKILSEVCVK